MNMAKKKTCSGRDACSHKATQVELGFSFGSNLLTSNRSQAGVALRLNSILFYQVVHRARPCLCEQKQNR